MTYAVILAGGVGRRFWPLSRNIEPKQFLSVCSGKSMIEETLHRIGGIIKKENIYIAASRLHIRRIKEHIKELRIPSKNFFFEPEGKNTLAPIALLSNKINSCDPDAVIMVLPCDHFIKKPTRFLKILTKAINFAQKGYILTLGISPKRPETGYGYIKIKAKLKTQNSKVYAVDRFIEKPNLETAKKFLKDKKYYWNGGIFIFKSSVILQEIRRFIPRVYNLIKKIKNNKDLNRFWRKLPSISIDYAVMEKTKKMALIPADFGWADMGSWQAVEGLMKKDKFGNIFKGNTVSLDCKNILVWGDKRLVATLGLKDTVIVDTKDALLVCAKDKTQDVKKIVEILKQKKLIKQI